MFNRSAYNRTSFNRSSSIVFEWLATANAETDASAAVKIIRHLNGAVEAVAEARGDRLALIDYNNNIIGGVNFVPSGAHTHPGHTHTVGSHTHSVSAHTHRVSAHTHTVKAHTHTVQDHTHKIEFGIYEGARASSATIKVDGVEIPAPASYDNLDIVEYLKTDGSGKIQRNAWHTIQILPNSMSRIVGAVFMQTFCNSRGGGDY